MPKLTYTLDGQEHTVEVGDSCSIGRAPTNDIALESEAGASRRHVQIMKLARSYELSDLGSTNGTKVNGKKVQRHKLEHGDRIEIGETALRWAERDDDDEIDIEEEISLDAGPSKKAAAAGEQSYLVFAGGDRAGERIALDKQRTTFGRRSSNTITIESQAVSGYHCEITREGGSYVLRDLGSTNGTMLDGEPIGEIAIQHGGRIRVGDQLLVFVDPSISDFEKAMAAVDDLGTEWGMLRAEMDMTRVQRARRSQVVAVIALLAVVGVIGYVFIANPELLQEQKPVIAEIDDNVVRDFSFEMVEPGWAAAAGSPAQGAFGTGDAAEGGAAQGSSYYTVTRDGPNGRPAIVEFTGKDFSISPGRTYEFGAKVRTSGGGRAAVRVLWGGAGEGAVGSRYSSTGLGDSGSWTEIKASAEPPQNTTYARLELINAGPGTADFDDVFLRPTGADTASEAASGSIKVASTPAGQITVTRGNDVLLGDLRVVGGAFGGAADRGEMPGRTGTATVTSVSADGSALRVNGTVFDPYTAEGAPFEITFAPSEERYVDITGSLPATAALIGVVPATVIEKGVGVWNAGGSFRESQNRNVPQALRVSVGSGKRYEISSGGDAFRFALYNDGTESAVALGSTEGTLALRLDGATTALNAKRDALRDAAQAAESQGRFGEAVRLYGDYASEFPEGSTQQDDARGRVQALQSKGQERLAKLRATAEGAIAYGEVPALVAAAEEAQALEDGYALAEAGELRTKVEEALAARGATVAQAAAAPQLARAADHQAGGRKILAQALYKDVIDRFPGTDAAMEAQKALQGLGE
jgi:pSer/pThr/pTyr-binding forkhead associated (FHA) protein